MGPTGEANFDISGPSGPSEVEFSRSGLELTPDNFGNQANINQIPRDSFTEDASNLPFCKCFHIT